MLRENTYELLVSQYLLLHTVSFANKTSLDHQPSYLVILKLVSNFYRICHHVPIVLKAAKFETLLREEVANTFRQDSSDRRFLYWDIVDHDFCVYSTLS